MFRRANYYDRLEFIVFFYSRESYFVKRNKITIYGNILIREFNWLLIFFSVIVQTPGLAVNV